MTNDKNHIKSKEAQEALDSIKGMERAGLKRVLPPIWFGATLALLVGTLIALVGAGIRTYNWLIIILMAVTIIYQNLSAGATERLILSTRTVITLIICSVASFFLLVITAQKLKDTFGFDWAPIVIGALAAVVFFIITIIARNSYFSRIYKQKTNEEFEF